MFFFVFIDWSTKLLFTSSRFIFLSGRYQPSAMFSKFIQSTCRKKHHILYSRDPIIQRGSRYPYNKFPIEIQSVLLYHNSILEVNVIMSSIVFQYVESTATEVLQQIFQRKVHNMSQYRVLFTILCLRSGFVRSGFRFRRFWEPESG